MRTEDQEKNLKSSQEKEMISEERIISLIAKFLEINNRGQQKREQGPQSAEKKLNTNLQFCTKWLSKIYVKSQNGEIITLRPLWKQITEERSNVEINKSRKGKCVTPN